MSTKARKFSVKQIRYLWAIGYLKSSPYYKNPQQAKQALQSGKRQDKASVADLIKAPRQPKPTQDDQNSLSEPNESQKSKSFDKKFEDSDHSNRDSELEEMRKSSGIDDRRFYSSKQVIYDVHDDQTSANAVDDYGRNAYIRINQDLRAGEDPGEIARTLESAIDKYGMSLPSDTRMSRGVGNAFAQRLHSLQDSGQLVGSEIHDEAFFSTARDKSVASRFTGFGHGVRFDLVIPKGSKTLYMGPNEDEYLFKPGARVKIESAETSGKVMIVRGSVRWDN